MTVAVSNDGSVTLSAEYAHCVLRLIANTTDEQRAQLGLNRLEDARLEEVYEHMARCGVGGHRDGSTPPYYGPQRSLERAA